MPKTTGLNLTKFRPSQKQTNPPLWGISGNALSTSSNGTIQNQNQNTMGSARHGMYKTRIYNIWNTMVARCTNKNNISYPRYGGRGIGVCSEWRTFVGFFKDMSSTYASDLTLERIDVNKGYSPDNCKWIPACQQKNNKRNNVKVIYKGQQYTVPQLSDLFGMPAQTINDRLRHGWSLDKALSEPIKRRPRLKSKKQ